MKTAFLSTFYPYRGGMAQFNACFYRALENLSEIKAFNFKRQYPEFLFPGKTQYVEQNDIADAIPAIPVLDSINPLSFSKTWKAIFKYQPDILIETLWMPFFAPSLGYVARKAGKKNIFRVGLLHNVIPHEVRFTDKFLTNYFLNSQDAYIVLAESVRDDLLKFKPNAKYILSGHPLYAHFPNSITKEQARQELNIPLDKKVLLFFGFIRDYKGLDILINTVAQLDNSYHLLIAGETYGDFSKYQQLIDSLGIQNKISIFNNYINDYDVQKFYNAADVNILPYRSATQSGIVGISYHFSLPVIVTNVGGLDKMVNPYGSGIVVDSPDSILLKESIEEFFATSNNKKYIDGIDKYNEINSWQSLANAVLTLYNERK